jgi:hypothetical protein
MNEQDLTELHKISSHVGHQIVRVERLRYEYLGRQERESGDLQLWLDDGALHISVAADGETVRVEDGPWVDPFLGPLSVDNEAYVATHGKWNLVNVSEEVPFSSLVGKTIEQVVPLTNRFGRTIGAQIVAGDVVLNVYVDADELFVTWGAEGVPRWGFETAASEPGGAPPSSGTPDRDSS